MLNENENMDELFRKAADDYPLRLDPKEWNEIAATYGEVPVAGRFNPMKRYFIALALLLVAGLTGFFFVNNSRKDSSIVSKSNPQKNIKETSKDEKVEEEEDVLNGTSNKQNKLTDFNMSTTSDTRANNSILSKSQSSILKAEVSNKPVSIAPFNNAISTTSIKATSSKGITTALQEEETQSPSATNKNNELFATTSTVGSRELEKPAPEKVLNAEQNSEIKAVTVTTSKASKENKQIKQSDMRRFYFGLTSSLNLSTVKHQATLSPMLGIGALGGVSFNKFISLETGIQVSSHKYFSSGNYFKPKAGVMPANMKVEEMIGRVNTIDLPVSLKYNFTSLHKNLFVTGGLSNTIITGEHNIYDVTVNGQAMSMIADYNKTKFIPVSSLNFSVGYQKQIGKSFRAQAEPYIQIPLRGTGVGYMPVTNFGLRLAFLKAK